MKKFDVIIIGAGAAGLMCAIEAGKRGRSVLVLDHANKAGKKILMSGGGRCNFTNLDVSHEHFISHNPQFCKSALSRYTPWHFIELVQQHKIPYHEKTLGQLFCDNKSKDILNMLLQECDVVEASIQLDTTVENIHKNDQNIFSLKTSKGHFECNSLVIASGGLSIPTMGASPFGYKIAEQFGIKVHPTRAGLVPFTLQMTDKDKYTALAGVSVECSIDCNNKVFREGMLFTHRGLSGPAMLQISSYWHPGDDILVNLLPDMNLLDVLKQAKQQSPNLTIKQVLVKHLPKNLASLFLSDHDDVLQSYSDKALKDVANIFQCWNIKPNGTEGYRTAEVTLGGVSCDAISSKTFEAKKVPGLYFIGEVLDITGWLGGYNFQWAWASGHAAGQYV